jgi:hypothetical protein
MDNGKRHAVILKGMKTGTEVTVGIFKDERMANLLANEIKRISEEGGFTIGIYELESIAKDA